MKPFRICNGRDEQAETDRKALRFAGGLGHTFVTVRTAADGTVQTTGEFLSPADARRLCPNDRLYFRSKRRGKWVRLLTSGRKTEGK